MDRAAKHLRFDAARSFVVGDASGDIELGRALGATTLLVRTGHGAATHARARPRADYVVADLREAADVIAGLLSAPS